MGSGNANEIDGSGIGKIYFQLDADTSFKSIL